MATKVIKMKGFLSTRDRKNELSETKFKCPFKKRDGKNCTVLLPFRHLSSHCNKIHEQMVGIKCLIDDCWWWCHKSLRCLTSHLSNTETHGALVIGGGPNLDGRVEVIPYEIAERRLKEHTLSCMVSTRDLCRFRSKMLKRNERAVAARMAKPEFVSISHPIKTEKENFLNFGNQFYEMMSKVTGVFNDWEAFENLMRANNMRYCKPTLT